MTAWKCVPFQWIQNLKFHSEVCKSDWSSQMLTGLSDYKKNEGNCRDMAKLKQTAQGHGHWLIIVFVKQVFS